MNTAAHLLAAVLIVAAVLVPIHPAAGQLAKAAPSGWPTWRGPNRDGKSPDKGLLKSWPADGPKRLWSVSGIGKGYSSVSAGGGLVYTTGHKSGALLMTAVDANGKAKWSRSVASAFGGRPGGSRATPTYDKGNLYIEAGKGLVGCYNAKSGRRIWTRSLSEFGGRVPGWGFSESVLIVGKLAVISPGGRSFMVALNKASGKTVWRSGGFGSAHYSSPIYVMHGRVPMIINGAREGLIGVHARTGRILWTKRFASGNTANCPTPAYSKGYVFWSVGYGKGAICVKLSASGTKAAEAWRTRDMVCHHGGFMILDGYIYGNHSGGWTCLKLTSGEKQWYERGVGKGSICYADGMLYLFGEGGGKAGLAECSPKGMELTGSFSVSGSGPSWAHPVVTGGRLYLRYADNLYCFDVRDPDKIAKKPAAPPKPAPGKVPAVKDRPPRKPVSTAADPERKAAGRLKLANAYIAIGRKDKAAAMLKEIISDYPDTDAAKAAAKALAKLN